jgi:hypothetical protein
MASLSRTAVGDACNYPNIWRGCAGSVDYLTIDSTFGAIGCEIKPPHRPSPTPSSWRLRRRSRAATPSHRPPARLANVPPAQHRQTMPAGASIRRPTMNRRTWRRRVARVITTSRASADASYARRVDIGSSRSWHRRNPHTLPALARTDRGAQARGMAVAHVGSLAHVQEQPLVVRRSPAGRPLNGVMFVEGSGLAVAKH